MHEIITIHIGQCGSCVGLNYWESLADEHGLDCQGRFVGCSQLQLDKIGVNFNESPSGRFTPRAIFADLDMTAVSALSASQCSGMFQPESLIDGSGEAASTYGRAFNSSIAHTMTESILNTLQRQLELSDRVGAIHIVHSLGGGTGSGLTSHLLQKGLSGIPVHTFSLFPTQSASIEAYNAVLCTPHIADKAELTYCWDIAAGIKATNGGTRPDIEDVNRSAAMMMLGLTACIRFPGQLNLSPGKLVNALVPLPRLHFLLPSVVWGSKHGGSVRELSTRMFSSDIQMASCDLASGRVFSAAGIYRGRIPIQALDSALVDLRTRREASFPAWLTHAFSVGVCDIPPRGETVSAVFFINSSSSASLFEQNTAQVRKLFANGRAFFHLFQEEGITENDMMEALDECDRLCTLFKEVEAY